MDYGWEALRIHSAHALNMPENKLGELTESLILIMKLIRIFSRRDQVAKRIGDSMGIKMILEIMKSYPLCIELQVDCSASLANLASVETNRSQMLEDGCIKMILENMTKFMNSPSVQTEVGCALILDCMRLHEDKVDLQIQAFHALSSLGKYSRDSLSSNDFIQMVLKSVQNHPNDVDLIGDHCLLCTGTSVFPACSQLLKRYNGIELILRAMRRFPQQESLQTTALFALGSIVMYDDDHRQVIYEMGGVQEIIGAMTRKYPRSKSSSILNGRRDSGIDSGDLEDAEGYNDDDDNSGPEPVLYARGHSKAYSKHILLQLFGSVALMNLSDNEKCRGLVIESGGIHHIFEASKKVSEHHDLWAILFYIFAKFTKNDEKSIYLKPRGLPSLAELARKCIFDHKVYLKYAPTLVYPGSSSAKMDDIEPLTRDRASQRSRSLLPSSLTNLFSFRGSRTQPSAHLRQSDSSEAARVSMDADQLAPMDTASEGVSNQRKRSNSSLDMEMACISEINSPLDGDHAALTLILPLMPLHDHLKEWLVRNVNLCRNCKGVCCSTSIRLYQLALPKSSVVHYICSLKCAQSDTKFAARAMHECSTHFIEH
ncbi:uncharacterized protein BJ171DRAFT_626521 [Polychytrium aggregatum]|uniref:uncharacterized protein n=1 Tax=Polychytrium aggregatum TaxID=110093 RepID=UPI0022FDDB7F|nr:uncharacterized protein BJ171DRAFT_626521 [Polychytrium aggregatum]KAI9202767.1 hypothetical protein BJ171DRAFT_626521 [Polychytrium aggregatum]